MDKRQNSVSLLCAGAVPGPKRGNRSLSAVCPSVVLQDKEKAKDQGTIFIINHFIKVTEMANVSMLDKDPELRARFIKLIEDCAKPKEIMDELQITAATITRWKKRLGLPVSAFQLDREPKTRERFCQMVKSGATYGEIANALGVEKSTVCKWKRRLGFPMKPRHVGNWEDLAYDNRAD